MSIFKTVTAPFRNIALYYFPTLGTVKLERMTNDPGNEMWRIGRGYNKTRPFVRIDWKNKAWRWTWDKSE